MTIAGRANLLDQLGGDDADDAGVPALGADDQRGVGLVRLAGGQRLGPDLFLDQLALAVAFVELLGQPIGGRGVGRQQQIERQLRLAEAAGGVEARRQAEADVARR